MNNFVHRPHRGFGRVPPRVTDVYHRVTCRHNVEIEIWPPRAEVRFADDETANPANTQLRFDATLYNSRQGVLWEVRDLAGNPGKGTIDISGLYRAPPKGLIQSGTTDIVIATAREDRLRRAYAWVTLVGVGPAQAMIEVRPKHATLFYQTGSHNSYIADSNKRRQFAAVVRNGSGTIEWVVNNTVSGTGPWFLYVAPNSGGTATATIRARLQANHAVFDEAKVQLQDYFWPGL